MKIATYNVWNHENAASRFDLLIREISRADADIIALQEATAQFYHDASAILTMYPHGEFRAYTGEDEGLAIFSRFPLESCAFLHGDNQHARSNALNVLFTACGARFSLTNVHLPWDSIKAKEEQIIAADSFIHAQADSADYFILLGDFNCDESSSVHRYLVGDQTLHSRESAPYWLDVAANYSALTGISLPPTLDCKNNPRWKGKNTIYAPETPDRIYIMDNWKPFSFKSARVFGTDSDPRAGLCASDHYGLIADISFAE